MKAYTQQYFSEECPFLCYFLSEKVRLPGSRSWARSKSGKVTKVRLLESALEADPRGGKSSRDRKRTGAFPSSSGHWLRDFDRTIRPFSEGNEIVRSIFRWNETSSRPRTMGRANLDWRPYQRLGRSRTAGKRIESNESHPSVLLVVALPTPVYGFI